MRIDTKTNCNLQAWFSRALNKLHEIPRNFDSFLALFAPFLIGRSNHSGISMGIWWLLYYPWLVNEDKNQRPCIFIWQLKKLRWRQQEERPNLHISLKNSSFARFHGHISLPVHFAASELALLMTWNGLFHSRGRTKSFVFFLQSSHANFISGYLHILQARWLGSNVLAVVDVVFAHLPEWS